MPCRQEVPDRGLDDSSGSYGSQLTSLVLWSPARNASNPVKTGGVLYPIDGVMDNRRFLT